MFQSAFDAVPLGRGYDSGDQIEGEGLFEAGTFAVNVERDAHLYQGQIGGLLAIHQLPLGQGLDVPRQRPSGRPGSPVFSEHLIEEIAGVVTAEFHGADLRFDP